MNDPYFFMTVLAPSFVLLPVLVALYRYRWLPVEARVLFGYLLVETCILTASSVLAHYKIPNTALYHGATLVETILLLYFFSVVFKKKKTAFYIKRGMILFPVLAVLNTLLLQPLNSFNSYTITLQYALVILLCFIYWWQFQEEMAGSWGQQPLNWIISGMLLYFSGSFILFAFSNYIITHFSKSTSTLIWNVHAALSVVMYISMAIGLYKYRQHE